MEERTLTDPRGGRWDVAVPRTPRERTRGLTEHPGSAMLFERTRSVHTYGMREPITVALLDRRYRVRRVMTVPPCRVIFPSPRTRHILEAPAGADLRPGDVLSTDPAASR